MSQMPSPSYAGHFDSLHYNTHMARGQGHSTLKKFLADLKSRNFDTIKYATYRTAAKLFYIQRSTNLHLIDIYNMIEAFRENGLNTLDYNAEIDEARLECIIASVFYALYKRLPSSNDIDVESNIVSLTQWIMHAYDREGSGRIRMLSIKTALTMLCSGRLIDKMRYVFTQISEASGLLNISRFESYLRELLILPAAVGEEPNFGYDERSSAEFFKPNGMMDPNSTHLEQFLQSVMAERASGSLFWVHMLHKLILASAVEHQIQCKACGRKPFNGLRYKCSQCYNYHICQDCFWREKKSGSHTSEHDMKEYSTWNKGEKGTSVRKRFLCSPAKNAQRLPDYPKEPEPNRTLDMSNIVPAMPADLVAPVSPMSNRAYNDYGSPDSTLSIKSSNDGASGGMSQEFVVRMDDEHRLIARYAQKLASEAAPEPKPLVGELSKEQRDMIMSLEERNRSLLREIRKLKAEHDQTVKNAQQVGTNPNVLAELKILRQRKDELEMRMSALQETRRELMVQLEGLMKLLKNIQSSPRGLQRVPSLREAGQWSQMRAAQTQSPTHSQQPASSLSGVNGDVKQAFGKTTGQENTGRNLRVDLLHAVDDVTSAMAVLVDELSKDETEETDQSSTISEQSSSQKYEQLTRDLDLIMSELSATQANQDVVDIRNPVITF
eukprot:Seg463.4 transcript_id=Seg463.4/GoldUCD/mRNA.D3Y31 product="Dystrobrevin beta" protein_id=Seg463.4/GoldUCD/D3Y31